ATLTPPPPRSTLFPYTTLFRSDSFDIPQERTAARVVLLGRTVANDLFGTSSPIGQRITINRVPFIVSGVLAERGQGLDVSNEDRSEEHTSELQSRGHLVCRLLL